MKTLGKWILILLLGIIGISACQNDISNQQTDFPNILDIQKTPSHKHDLSAFGFSDQGAWHAYSLPDPDSTNLHGGFTGPLLMNMYGTWLSRSGLQLEIVENGKYVQYIPEKYKATYYPGKLEIVLCTENLKIKRRLIFTDTRTALVHSEITNISEKKCTFNWQLKSTLSTTPAFINEEDNYLELQFADSTSYIIQTNNNVAFSHDSTRIVAYGAMENQIAPGETVELSHLESYVFNLKEKKETQVHSQTYLNDSKTEFLKNEERWNSYLFKVLNKMPLASEQETKLAVKCIETLLSNWRSPSGDLKHHGVFPSAAYNGFYGFWSWDSWKHAVALSKFHPDLAKEGMHSMFQYQNEEGMIADCVYRIPSENNWRDTKPPLAAWAVWRIFQETKDTVFVKEFYPLLTKYHHWWYKFRDVNENGLCEYGSSDGSLIAAKWESGMDNAVRFDKSSLLSDKNGAWSMNQESVDLNIYLQKEKKYLSKMAKLLGYKSESDEYAKQADKLKSKINQQFWSEKSYFYFDFNIEKEELIPIAGPEGWLALWGETANSEQAKLIKDVMMDSSRFNHLIPLPTLDASHPDFNPLNGYWRGPVWIDQFWFGYEGLRKYGFDEEAGLLKDKLLNNAEGLLVDLPIRENYHPLSGEGLNAEHFSWSAAHLLLLLCDE